MTSTTAIDHILFGTAYYDEYMPQDRLTKDIAMMKAAHINTVRIAESTWSTLEPQPGEFDFSPIDRVIDAMEEAGIDSIYNYLAAHAMNATFVVPQCPADKSWGGAMNAVLKGLIEHCISDGSIDSGQLYIFGGSMGGTGTWEMLSDYPGLFAAAMPVAANPSRCNAESTAQTPVFTVMGTEDKIMDIQVVSDFIDELTSLGNENVFEIADGWTHEITCIESYTTQRMDWVFAHRK